MDGAGASLWSHCLLVYHLHFTSWGTQEIRWRLKNQKRQDAQCALCRWRSDVPGTWGPAVKLRQRKRSVREWSGMSHQSQTQTKSVSLVGLERGAESGIGPEGWKVAMWMSICSNFGFRTRFGSWGRQHSMSWSKAPHWRKRPLVPRS